MQFESLGRFIGKARSCAIAAFVAFVPANAEAEMDPDWLTQRHQAFDDWRSANAGLAHKIESLRSETVSFIEERRKEKERRAADHRAKLIARSQSLSPSQRQDLEDRLSKAVELSKAGNLAEASVLFRAILAVDPANITALVRYGELLRRQGDLEAASTQLTLATSIPGAPDNPMRLAAMLALQHLPPPVDPVIAEPPVIFRAEGAPSEIWDLAEAPIMTIIPAGEYTMGSPSHETNHQESERQHRVTIGYPLAVSRNDVTRGEFATFVADTGHEARGCSIYVDGRFKHDPEADWRSPGFSQSDDEPVVCVNYHDGLAYTAWLSRKTGHNYRLPSEAEWEYAVRGGTTTLYPWGEEIGRDNANCDGCTGETSIGKPSRGGTFPPNGFGLHDVSGNVWKWLADCWNPTYEGAPTNGSAWLEGNCALRGRRGGSWFNLSEGRAGDVRAPFRLRSAARFGSLPDLRFSSFGLRVVRAL